MPLEEPARVARTLAAAGYNAEREAVTRLANAADPAAAAERAAEAAPDDALTLTVEHVQRVLADGEATAPPGATPSVSGGDDAAHSTDGEGPAPPETEGAAAANGGSGPGRASTDREATATGPVPASTGPATASAGTGGGERDPRAAEITGDVTGRSTGTGEYWDFVSLFQDRYERLAAMLSGRVNHRPADAVGSMAGGGDVELIGMVDDVRTTVGGHRLLELEDTSGTVACIVLDDREFLDEVETVVPDEVVGVRGTLSDDGEMVFVDELHVPDVPRTHQPSTADRHVQAALVSDVHVGSQEFRRDAWRAFADWFHTDEAAAVEYLLIAGDMVEGVGVYPDQDRELDVIDIYEQYETFARELERVPADIEIVMIPGNHDAVRLAEPQPGFDEELRDLMGAHGARVVGNPSTVTVEGVDVLMYHGVSLDELVAELPDSAASYERPHEAMSQLLRKRHLAPTFGNTLRIAPEDRDYLVVEDVPDVFHAGHVHTLGVGTYHGVRVVNSGCWQDQTAFQQRVNLEPDVAVAPILDLDTLDVTVRKFR